MMRLGFGTRLVIIFLTSLVVMQLLAIFTVVQQRNRASDSGLRLPLPDQTAALVELLESLPKDRWPLVVRAANSADVNVRLAEGTSEGREPDWFEAPVVDLILRRYLGALGDRDVKVRVEPSTELLDGPTKFLAWASPGSVEIDVRLKSGERLLVSGSGYQSLSILGLPPGFWAGVMGIAVAGLALFLLRREARPLVDLANAVDDVRVGLDGEQFPDAPRSAPEIRGLIAAFNRLTNRVASLLRNRMALVGGISHDLRTYVTRLRLRAEQIPDSTERLKAIADLDDMSRLIDDSLLAFEAGAPIRYEELVEVAPLLLSEVDERRSAGAMVTVQITDAVTAAQVLGDPVGLRRLIQNIVDNAIKYGSRADIRADVSQHFVEIDIEDEGPGIDPTHHESIMEPFVRLERSRNRSTGGAGLGLAIARGIAEAHGGHIGLKNRGERGLRVSITLPLYQAT